MSAGRYAGQPDSARSSERRERPKPKSRLVIVPRHLSPPRSAPKAPAKRPPPTASERRAETQRAVRTMIRKYLTLDTRSSEALQLSRNVRSDLLVSYALTLELPLANET